jgi:hypothetical protein
VVENFVPDYSVAAMSEKAPGLAAFQHQLAAIDTSDWSVAQLGDKKLVAAEMNGPALPLATQYGNFNSRSTASNHGSLRTGSRNGSVFSHIRPGSCTRTAVASHSRALPPSPHCA